MQVLAQANKPCILPCAQTQTLLLVSALNLALQVLNVWTSYLVVCHAFPWSHSEVSSMKGFTWLMFNTWPSVPVATDASKHVF
jgi:hypothetical protein